MRFSYRCELRDWELRKRGGNVTTALCPVDKSRAAADFSTSRRKGLLSRASEIGVPPSHGQVEVCQCNCPDLATRRTFCGAGRCKHRYLNCTVGSALRNPHKSPG